MPHAALAGLPRLVRVADETRSRGHGLVSLGLAVVAYWLLAWLLDEPVDPLVTGLHLGGVAAVALPASLLVSRRRVREGLARAMRPPRLSVHETRADARERRTRLVGVVMVAVVALLVFDRYLEGDGRMAGLLTGLFLSVGIAEFLESRRWAAAERSREGRLYVLVRAGALMSPFGVTEVFEIARSDDHRDREREDVPYVI